MSDRAMIEASMFLHRDSLNQIRGVAQAGALGTVAVSDALVRLFEFDPVFAVALLGRYYGIPDTMIDADAIQEMLRSAKRATQRSADEEVAGLVRYQRTGAAERRDMYSAVNAITGNEWITQIVFEEWEFLTTQSWLFARVRKAYETMIAAGATAVEISKNRLEAGVRATVKKSRDEPLTNSDAVRALAKWVAVGGSSATALVEPVTGSIISAAAGLFLLYDP